MDARWVRVSLLAALLQTIGTVSLFAASYRTPNFIIEAPTKELAEEIGKEAERFRKELAIEWLGAPMPNWARPCPIVAKVDPTLGAGGATSFVFDGGEVFGWKMEIQGTRERVLDSVLPHEVTHTIFASYFRQPLPRWADEGACTTVEDISERRKQQAMLIEFLQTNRGIAFNKMFAMKEYPRDVLPLYAQGYSLARFLIDQGGRRKFVTFLSDGLKSDNWPGTLRKHYNIQDLSELQTTWLAWVQRGSPLSNGQNGGTALASNTSGSSRQQQADSNLIYRGQSLDQPAAELRSQDLVPIRMSPQAQALASGKSLNNDEPAPYRPNRESAVGNRSAPADNGEIERVAVEPPSRYAPRSSVHRVIFEWRREEGAE